jgi:hypothetical protein
MNARSVRARFERAALAAIQHMEIDKLQILAYTVECHVHVARKKKGEPVGAQPSMWVADPSLRVKPAKWRTSDVDMLRDMGIRMHPPRKPADPAK